MNLTQAEENYRAMSLSMAHAIQQALLPKECPKCAGANLAAKYRPVEHIGGDFYDFTHLGKEQIGLLIGDVIGHSIHSALIMALLLGLLRADRRERLHPVGSAKVETVAAGAAASVARGRLTLRREHRGGQTGRRALHRPDVAATMEPGRLAMCRSHD